MHQIVDAHQIRRLLRGMTALLLLAGSPALPVARWLPHAAAANVLPVAGQWVYPVGDPGSSPTYGSGNANGYAITQGFNTSCDPSAGQGHYYTGYYFCGHSGVDLSADGAYGGAVRAVAAGQVVFAGPDGSYGNMVRIEHLLPNGQIVYSQYEHLGYNTVSVWYGEIVACGQQVGAVGDSGFAQGARLHFEIKDSNSDGPGYTFGNAALLAGFYDPLAFLQAHIPVPTPPPAVVATAVAVPLFGSQSAHRMPPPSTDSEGSLLLSRFLHQYHHFVVVTTPALRLRAGPNPGARQVGVVKQHTKLALLGVSGIWLRVALPENVVGWVHGAFVSGTIPASLRPPAPPHRAVGSGGGGVRFPVRHRAATPTPRPDLHHVGPLAQVLSDGIHVRSGPHLHDAVLFLAYRGSMVAVRASRAEWIQVTFTNGATGWILNRYLVLPQAHTVKHRAARAVAVPVRHRAATLTPRPDLHHVGPLARVLSDGIHVRSGPHLHDAVLFLAYRGSMVAVRARHVSWVQVTFTNGATGWILSHYLRLPGNEAGAHPHPPSMSSPRQAPAAIAHPAAIVPAHRPSQTQSPAPAYYTWATTLYVRSAPRLAGTVLTMIGENTAVRLLGTRVSWSHIRLGDGTEGWVLTHYVKDHPKIYAAQPGAGNGGR